MNIRDMQKILNRIAALEAEVITLRSMIVAREVMPDTAPFDNAVPRRPTISLKKDVNGPHG